MNSNFDKIKELNKSILEDMEIKRFIEFKAELLSKFPMRYLVNEEMNIIARIPNELETILLNKIDLLIKCRTDKIISFYKN